MQAEHAPGLGPAAVIADHHAHVDAVEPAHGRADDGEAEIPDFEIAFFEVLDGAPRVKLGMPGQMDFAVFQHDLAGGVDQDGGVEVAALRRALGVAEVEADIEALGGGEEGCGFIGGHGALEPAVGLGAIRIEMAGEEGGQREFGEDHELGAAGVGALHEADHAGDRDVPPFRLLDGA